MTVTAEKEEEINEVMDDRLHSTLTAKDASVETKMARRSMQTDTRSNRSK